MGNPRVRWKAGQQFLLVGRTSMAYHSPLGASSAERWMNCPGSNALLQHIGELTASDEPEYRTEGTAAHEACAYCLEHGLDAWEVIGQKFGDDFEFTAEMAPPVQVYLDECRPLMVPGHTFIEYHISSPIHPLFYGTLDFGVVDGLTIRIRDYKHGEGLPVEVEWNPQFLYYVYGLLEDYPEVQNVDVGVVQPRIPWHPDGVVRTWSVSADAVRTWVRETLIPAMNRTEVDKGLDAGPWCRFCPAKLVCPLLSGLYRAASVANPAAVPNLSDERLGQEYQYLQGVAFYKTALEREVFARLSAGRDVYGTKLVQKKANRVFKPGSDVIFRSRFGEAAFTKPEMKGPAEMERIGPEAKELVHEYSYTPQTGLTVALLTDSKPAVKVKTLAEAFAGTEIPK